MDKETPQSAETPPNEDRAGRVVVDARGRNVWQWAKNAIDSTSILLKRLENKDLALEPTQKVPVIRGADPRATPGKTTAGKQTAPTKPGAKPADARVVQKGAKPAEPARSPKRGETGGGFDPYNSR